MIDGLVDDKGPEPGGVPGDITRELIPSRMGHYAIAHKLGEGGMGVVYAARDARLERTVALKTMSAVGRDESARRRFWREARAAASVNHPNVCQIYEIGEDAGELFIAMELLEGEGLDERLRRGPVSPAEALPIGLAILAALSALHTRTIIHRDLKPSNVFLTPHGVKLLDFGLARPGSDGSSDGLSDVTRTGSILGTPRYMAPEQTAGDPVDPRSDLFAAGAIIFEMLAGRPAFGGRTIAEIVHATRYEQPPALTGSPAVAGIDRVIRRAMAKSPEDRPATADEMAAALRAIPGVSDSYTPVLARTLTRLVVLPFRVLRPDPETDFLAFSLADAVASSLSGISSLVVRSSAMVARFATEAPDLRALATEADVDRVVIGAVLRSGDQLRASVQLVEAPDGTVVASHTVQSSMGDLFGLQDDIASRVAGALSPPLGAAAMTPPPPPDAPGSPRAYELYLRANELARTYEGLARARDVYRECLDLDPAFAPAWAHLGRCYRVIGKFVEGSPDSETRAEDAFRRALALNPRLAVAHKFYANLEADMGHTHQALTRLLEQARRRGNDPELFAGLVHACRYSGLYEQSIAAHHEARRLDPNVPTSLEQTLMVAGQIDRLLAIEPPALVAGADDGIRVIGLGLAGRRDEAKRRLGAMRQSWRIATFQHWIDYLLDWLDCRAEDMIARLSEFNPLKIRDDPEAIFQEGWLLCDVGAHDAGLPLLRRAVDKGYFAAPTLAAMAQFDALRSRADFKAIVEAAEAGRRRALVAFQEAGADRMLGL